MAKKTTEKTRNYIVNGVAFEGEEQALTEIETLRIAQVPLIIYKNLRRLKQFTYELERSNYYVTETLLPRPQRTQSNKKRSNNRSDSNTMQDMQESTE